MIGLITTARHEREIAARDAEIAGLMKRLQGQEEIADRLHHALWCADEVTRGLQARLAPFIAKRERDAKGHFLPTKGRE